MEGQPAGRRRGGGPAPSRGWDLQGWSVRRPGTKPPGGPCCTPEEDEVTDGSGVGGLVWGRKMGEKIWVCGRYEWYDSRKGEEGFAKEGVEKASVGFG